MDNAKDFKSCAVVVSEVKQQGTEQGKCIWELKDWKKNYATLRDNSFCTIKVGSDKRHAIRIFFGNPNYTSTTADVADLQRPGYLKRFTYVPLWVELKMVGCNDPVIDTPVTVSLDVHQLSENLVSEKSFGNGSWTFVLGANPQGPIVNMFLEYSYINVNINNSNTSGQSTVYIPQPENLRFGINATISPINDAFTLESSEKTSSEVALSEHLGKMYQSDANFSDLKLETKDNMTLSTHKFIVAARSAVLNEVIKKETEKADFSGTIKVDVDAKPMLAILNWMYTGEVYEKAGLVMEQLIEAAMRFDLPELLKILDKKMISICTKENMFLLYQAAQKCGMLTAVNDIGAFIKSNV